jgi:hypothetical protein
MCEDYEDAYVRNCKETNSNFPFPLEFVKKFYRRSFHACETFYMYFIRCDILEM